MDSIAGTVLRQVCQPPGRSGELTHAGHLEALRSRHPNVPVEHFESALRGHEVRGPLVKRFSAIDVAVLEGGPPKSRE